MVHFFPCACTPSLYNFSSHESDNDSVTNDAFASPLKV